MQTRGRNRWLLGLLALGFAATVRADEAKAAKSSAPSLLGTEAGQVRDDNALNMRLVWCPPGFVTMEQVEVNGENIVTGKTPVNAFVSHGFWLGKFEVTQAEWKQVMETEPWKGQNGQKGVLKFVQEGDNFPATLVTWHDAMSYCQKFTERERAAGRLNDDWEYSLPTEAQWERACRARTDTRFSFGDDELKLGDYEWFEVNASNAGERYAHGVGQKKPNPWRLHDMHGNVEEWCRDEYSRQLPGGRDPEGKGVKIEPSRVLRGGAWDRPAIYCTSAIRMGILPKVARANMGFRVALTPVRQAADNPAK